MIKFERGLRRDTTGGRNERKWKRKIIKFTSYPENSDTSVCKTKRKISEFECINIKGHGIVFEMLYAEEATVNGTD